MVHLHGVLIPWSLPCFRCSSCFVAVAGVEAAAAGQAPIARPAHLLVKISDADAAAAAAAPSGSALVGATGANGAGGAAAADAAAAVAPPPAPSSGNSAGDGSLILKNDSTPRSEIFSCVCV